MRAESLPYLAGGGSRGRPWIDVTFDLDLRTMDCSENNLTHDRSILHSTGDGQWTLQPTGVAGRVVGFIGDSGGVLAVMEAGLMFSTGAGTWSRVSAPPISSRGAWEPSATGDLYLVGSGATIEHRMNGIWRAEESNVSPVVVGCDRPTYPNACDPMSIKPDLSAVWGSAPNNVYAVGPGLILRSDGAGHWTKEPGGFGGVAI